MAFDNEESGFSQTVLPRQAGQVYWNTAQLTLNDLKAIDSESRRNMQIVFVLENKGLYYYDLNSSVAVASPTILVPDDGAGRWVMIFAVGSSTIIFDQTTEPPIIEGAQWYDRTNKQWKGCNGIDWGTILG